MKSNAMNTRMSMLAVVAAMVLAGCQQPPATLQADPVKARVDAQVTLRTALDSPHWTTRARAIEALSQVEGAAAGRMYAQALADPEPGVRFAAAVAIGDAAYEPAKARLTEMAGRDPVKGENDRRVYAGVLYALWRMGEPSAAYDLATLLGDPEWAVRDSAALVLGKVKLANNKPLLNLLQMQLAFEPQSEVKMRLLESLAQLGDPRSRDMLLTYTQTSEFAGQDLQAINALGKVGGPAALRKLGELTENDWPAYTRLAAVAALADQGAFDDGAYRYATLAITNTSTVVAENRTNKNVVPEEADAARYLAVLALGRMNRVEAVDTMLPSLRSESGPLRVAAAMSILRLLPPVTAVMETAQAMEEADVDDAAAAQPSDVDMSEAAPADDVAPAKVQRPKLSTADAKD